MSTESRFKGHEAFWAFVLLLFAIVGLVVYASSLGEAVVTDILAQAKIRILDGAVTGLMAILGMAAQALFRTNQADKDLAAAAKATAEKVPPATGDARKELNDEHS